MARLAAVEKLLYYPTQDEIFPLIARHLPNAYNITLQCTLFDPCCGQGEAHKLIPHLGKTWRVQGVELDHDRAATAAKICGQDNIHQGDIRNFAISGEADLLFLNPPYDRVDGKQLELEFLNLTAKYLRAGGLLIYIIPSKFVDDGPLTDELSSALQRNKISQVKVYRYPDPIYSQFKQVVVFGQSEKAQKYISAPDLKYAGILGDVPEYSYRYQYQNQPHYYFIYKDKPTDRLDIVKAFDAPKEPLDPIKELKDVLGDPDANSFELRPLMPMSKEHAALVASAGMLNGVEIDGKVFRGSTYKVKKTREKEYKNERGDKVTETIEIEQLVAQLTCLDLSTGHISRVNNDEHPTKFNSLLLGYANQFVAAAQNLYPPLFTDDDLLRYDFGWIHSPQKLKGEDVGLMFPQKRVAAATLKGWRSGIKDMTIVGEMGTGKTAVSLAASGLLARGRKTLCQKIIVLTPAKDDLVEKWKDEAKAVLTEAKPLVVSVKTIPQLQKAMAYPGLTVIVIKETTAKDSSSWEQVPPFTLHKPHVEYRYSPEQAPDNVVTPAEFHRQKTNKGNVKFANGKTFLVNNPPIWLCPNPNCEQQLDEGIGYNNKYVHPCGEPFWTNVAGDRKPRYPLARYIRQHYKNRYILISDEFHTFKGGSTCRSYASNDLIKGAYRTLSMTGTIFGGKASTLFYLLYRTSPAFRDIYDPRDEQEFVNTYGLFKRIVRKYPQYSGNSRTGYAEYASNPEERPGMDPGMVAWLLPNTSFLALRDFDFEMPPYSEHTLFVPCHDGLKQSATQFLDKLKKEGVKLWVDKNDKSLLSQWMWARYGVWDVPDKTETVVGDKGKLITFVPPTDAADDFLFPKEEAFLRYVWQEKLVRRRVLCYVQQINKRDPTPRLIKLLARYGMMGVTMYSEVKDRLSFIRHHIRQGADVIFTNSALVAEGINIIETPTIIWYQHDFNVYRMPQANRRPYRFIQEKEVKVIYLAYNDTPQVEAMHYIAEKVAAQQALQGDIKNGLAALETEDDFVSRLQEAVSDQTHFESDLGLADLPLLPPPITKTSPPPQPPRKIESKTNLTQAVLF